MEIPDFNHIIYLSPKSAFNFFDFKNNHSYLGWFNSRYKGISPCTTTKPL